MSPYHVSGAYLRIFAEYKSAEKLTFRKNRLLKKKPNGGPLEKEKFFYDFFIFWGVLGPLGPLVIKFSPPFHIFYEKSFPKCQFFRQHIYIM